MEQSEKSGLTGKQLLVFEACQKIIRGREMEREGLLELSNLISGGGQIDPPSGHKLQTAGLFRKKPADDKLIARILEMIDRGDKVTSRYIQSKLKITDRHVSRLQIKMKDKIKVNKSPAGAQVWTKVTKNKKKASTGITIPVEENVDRVIAYLKTHDWVTMRKMVDDLKITWYPLKRTVDYMRGRGMIKEIERTNNPAHDGTSAYGRKYTYMEAT